MAGVKTARKLLCLQRMTRDNENAVMCEQIGYQEIWQCVTRCVCHSHLMGKYGL